MADIDQNLLEVFVTESLDALGQWESACLRLESEDSVETVNLLFRLAHNMKGSSKAIGLQALGAFIHQVEEVITKLKQKTLSPTPELVTLLLDVADSLRSWLEQLTESPEHVVSTRVLEDRLAGFSSESPGAKNTTAFVASQDGDIVFDDAVFQSFQSAKTNASMAIASPPFQAPLSSNDSPTMASAVKNNATLPTAENRETRKHTQDESLRVSVRKLDQLINLVGEIVVNQNILSRHRQQNTLHTDKAIASFTQMERTIGEVQNLSMSLRMLSLEQTFQKMQRIVRDLSTAQQKDIAFVIQGGEVELDKGVVDSLADPLTHLIRNGVDHGIESAAEREKIGKTKKATLTLKAEQKDDHVLVTISEDGRGLDREKIFRKAVEKGLIRADAKLTEEEINRLIFLPGFSTKEQVTDVSGRGVGMDVVQRAVDAMKGRIEIKTQLGFGTTFSITLPLTLSIVRGLVARIGQERFVIPTSQLLEIIDCDELKVETHTSKGQVVNLRGEVMPILSLAKAFGWRQDEKNKDSHPAVVIQHEGKKLSYAVDSIVDEQTIVLKNLAHELQGLPGIIAGAVLSDGEPALVLNLQEITQYRSRHAAH